MVLTITNKLPDFTPVQAGATATTAPQRGHTYSQMMLLYAEGGTKANEATMKAAIERVALKINGVTRYEVSGTTLIDLNKYYGIPFKDGILPINFARPFMRTPGGVEQFVLGTANLDSLSLEVKIASGRTNPTLSGQAELLPVAMDLGWFAEVREINDAASVAGRKEMRLTRGNGDLIAAHIRKADIEGVQVKLNNNEYIGQDTDLEAYHYGLQLQSNFNRAPQSGYVHIDAMKRNAIGDAVPLAGLQNFEVNPTVTAAGALTVIMETLNAPLGLPRAV